MVGRASTYGGRAGLEAVRASGGGRGGDTSSSDSESESVEKGAKVADVGEVVWSRTSVWPVLRW
jgi:hypothetical protein